MYVCIYMYVFICMYSFLQLQALTNTTQTINKIQIKINSGSTRSENRIPSFSDPWLLASPSSPFSLLFYSPSPSPRSVSPISDPMTVKLSLSTNSGSPTSADSNSTSQTSASLTLTRISTDPKSDSFSALVIPGFTLLTNSKMVKSRALSNRILSSPFSLSTTSRKTMTASPKL